MFLTYSSKIFFLRKLSITEVFQFVGAPYFNQFSISGHRDVFQSFPVLTNTVRMLCADIIVHLPPWDS